MNRNQDLEMYNPEEGLAGRTISMPIIDRNRKDDLTVEELQQMACFKHYSFHRLNEILEVVKTYTVIIIELHQKSKQRMVMLNTNTHQQKKAA